MAKARRNRAACMRYRRSSGYSSTKRILDPHESAVSPGQILAAGGRTSQPMANARLPARVCCSFSHLLHEEAIAVMYDRIAVLVVFFYGPRSAPDTACSMTRASTIYLLEHARVVEIELLVYSIDTVMEPSMAALSAVLRALKQGANLKELMFYLKSWTTLHTEEMVLPHDEEFRTAISSLQ
ncbi:hypothetical protein LTR97_001935 [Elasticomyces elasticus]|uniref:Uncharacterized protein n=1 Tax=Elasticomyces elasticus TaxID=574655 RepID=A0AAN8A447_9PEZI|nr:hypothetical protein LTR97_001935 [Elasticomyces elasticus]